MMYSYVADISDRMLQETAMEILRVARQSWPEMQFTADIIFHDARAQGPFYPAQPPCFTAILVDREHPEAPPERFKVVYMTGRYTSRERALEELSKFTWHMRRIRDWSDEVTAAVWGQAFQTLPFRPMIFSRETESC